MRRNIRRNEGGDEEKGRSKEMIESNDEVREGPEEQDRSRVNARKEDKERGISKGLDIKPVIRISMAIWP